MRTRLCIQPVCQSSRIPASTIGYPVCPPLPGRQMLRRIRPGKVRERRAEWRHRQTREVIEEVIGEFPPRDFGEKLIRRLLRDIALANACVDPLPDIGRADLTAMEMRREPRCALNARPVAPFRVVIDCLIEKAVEPLPRARFPRRPCLAEAARPIRLGWKQPPIRKGVTRNLAIKRLELRRRPQRRALTLPAKRPPERRKHLVRPARLRQQLIWIMQQRANKPPELTAVRAETPVHVFFELPCPGLKRTGTHDRISPDLGGQRRNLLNRLPAPQDELTAFLA